MDTVTVESRIRFLILQHPQEARNPLNTATLVAASLRNCRHRVGLSWRSLSVAVGEKAVSRQWAVLFLGTRKDSAPRAPFSSSIDGVVILDGTWKQSKTLWWRNPWLLKLNRIVLEPSHSSLYGKVRRQPRKQCLSTIEAAAECLSMLENNPLAANHLKETFSQFLLKGGNQDALA